MELKRDRLKVKIIDGGKVQSKREIVEEFTAQEHLNSIFKVEQAIATTKESLEQNKQLLKALTSNGLRDLLEKVVKDGKNNTGN